MSFALRRRMATCAVLVVLCLSTSLLACSSAGTSPSPSGGSGGSTSHEAGGDAGSTAGAGSSGGGVGGAAGSSAGGGSAGDGTGGTGGDAAVNLGTSFGCSSDTQCVVGESYCYAYSGGVAGGGSSRSCLPIPPTCTGADATECSCVCPVPPNGGGYASCGGGIAGYCTCTSAAGAINVTCAGQ
jgi:hypothetical protein